MVTRFIVRNAGQWFAVEDTKRQFDDQDFPTRGDASWFAQELNRLGDKVTAEAIDCLI